MQPKTLDQFEALVFDVYGTLMDWETGLYTALEPVLKHADSTLSRHDALRAFYAIENKLVVQNPRMPYNEILGAAHSAFATRLGTTSSPAEDAIFGKSIAEWPAFPDTVSALATLKKYYKLIVLSNIDNYSFNILTRPVLESGGGTFDLVLTAQDLGAYKPDPANFEAALKAIEEKFGIKKEKVLITAVSLQHDHEPANALGISSAWIDREGSVIGVDSRATYDFRFKTLGEMAATRDSELGKI